VVLMLSAHRHSEMSAAIKVVLVLACIAGVQCSPMIDTETVQQFEQFVSRFGKSYGQSVKCSRLCEVTPYMIFVLLSGNHSGSDGVQRASRHLFGEPAHDRGAERSVCWSAQWCARLLGLCCTSRWRPCICLSQRSLYVQTNTATTDC